MPLQQDFIETTLATKFANFLIRVYQDNQGKETIVLRTEKLNIKQPVLVRVHSECFTGDVLGSLKCDCGKQLAKSLQMISEEGGLLIYLRQEGRGIGLFEKMKSYQLQTKGYDTFEANVLLGHQPDQRSYEMVKTILHDLHISRIRLLTNNPSKVSDIAKLGIEIVERIPLVSRPNKHNRAYLETKKKKFQHFLGKSAAPYYYYQFFADEAKNVSSVIESLKEKKRDPLLRIGVAISADALSLKSKREIDRINSIISTCKKQTDFIPIIHFSFRNSKNTLKDVNALKELWPSISTIQLNDLPSIEAQELKKICELFSVQLPLTDENFDLARDPEFRDVLLKYNSFIALDNSKGTGIKETKASYLKKIDILLAHGFHNIILSGGFGPDHLDVYFEIRRFYRINFSIDAETNLKTKGKLDPEKAKLYLLQLIRFDDPKEDGIQQTRKYLKEHHRTDWEKTHINGHEFSIHPQVFHAGHFPSSSWFASELCTLVKNESKFCEVGCGCGVISCLVSLANPKLQITATDINPYASENTQLNVKELGLSSRITVHTGDVLDSVNSKSSFDTIFWALPFGFLDPGKTISFEEAQVFDPGYRAIRKFFQTAKQYLKPNGRLLIGFSTDLGHTDLLEELAKEYSIKLVTIREKVMKEETDITFEILEGRIISN